MEADERIEALKQYYGITQDGKLVVRGIEARKHDTPRFIKKYQTELLYALFDCNDIKDVITKGYDNALFLVVVLPDIGDNLAYRHGLHFCQEVYPYTYRNQK